MAGMVRVSRRTALLGSATLAVNTLARQPGASARTPAATPASESALSGLEAFADPAATAADLVNAWFTLLTIASDGRTEGGDADPAAAIEPYLDPAFQLQRASGERYVATDFVPAQVEAFTIQNVRETRPAANLVVARYAVRAIESTAADTSMVLSDELAPRLSVFRWDEDVASWLMISHANFNTPVSTICDESGLEPALNPMVPTAHDDVVLGVSLVEAASAAAVEGNTLPVLDPQIQVQTAGGYGYTTTAEREGETKLKPSTRRAFLVTRHEDVIVVSFRGSPSGTVNAVEVSSEESPRLLTFRLNEQGEWKVIATAYFSTVASVPDGIDCAPAA